MTTIKPGKSVSIITLLGVLIIVAVFLNVLILSLFQNLITDYTQKSKKLSGTERGLNSFRREVEDYYKNKLIYLGALLDASEVAVDSSQVSNKDLPDFPSYNFIAENVELRPILKQFSAASSSLLFLDGDILAWRNSYSPLFDDIKHNVTLNKVRVAISAINNSLLSFEGRRKLNEAKKLRKIRSSAGGGAAKLSAQYIADFLGQSALDVNSLKYELNDLSLFIERLNSENNLYDLPDLRDNKIKQSLERLQKTIRAQHKPNAELSLSVDAIDILSKLIFGEDYYLDKEHQTIVAGRGGYFALRQAYLEHLLIRNKFNVLLHGIETELDQILREFNESIYVLRGAVENEQKVLLRNIWNKVLLLSLLFLLVFIAISFYIAYLVKLQIEKEKKTRNEINSIIEGTGDAMSVIDTDYNVLRINTKMSELIGVSKEDAIGRKCYHVFPGQCCGTDKCLLRTVLQKNAIVQYEALKRDKDGQARPFDVIAAPLKEGGRIVSVIESYRDISNYKLLQQKIEANNAELKKNETVLTHTLTDLQKINKELKDTQEQLIRSEKMASIGLLSAGVAHEINNPTSFVLANLEVLVGNIQSLLQVIEKTDALVRKYFVKEHNGNKDFYKEFELIIANEEVNFLKEDLPLLVSQSIDGAKRIQKIVRNLREFAHPGVAGKKITNVNEEIDKALSLINNEIKYNCEVVKDLQDIPKVMANAQQLDQVLINLIVNASQAIEGKGVISIKTYVKEPFVIVEVADNGQGITQEHISQIFNPFFTTKDVGKGTGLGLSIVYGIINEHAGKIEVESKVGEGTLFRVFLPIAI